MATGAYAMALTQNALHAAGFTRPAPVRGSGRFAAAAEPTSAGWTLPVALLAGVAAAVAVGALVGVAAARLRGPYLAGLTLALGLVVGPVAAMVDAFGGEQGLRVHVPAGPDGPWTAGGTRWRVWVALVATAVVLFVLANLVRGRIGRQTRAVRDDEAAAALAGLSVARVRVRAFVVSAATAGLAGGIYVYLTGTVLPGYFGFTTSLLLVLAAVVGGLGSLAGAAWGTLVVVAVPIATNEAVSRLDADPALSLRLAGNLPLALLGATLIVVTLIARGGVAAMVNRILARARSWSRPSGRPAGDRGVPARARHTRMNDDPVCATEPETSTREDGVCPP
jgi:branched-chain amino acid transport system permease protein